MSDLSSEIRDLVEVQFRDENEHIINFHQLEVVGLDSGTQLQIGKKYIYWLHVISISCL